MKLTFKEISLIKHTLLTTGEMEATADGKEALAPRKLKDGIEISQRRHFTKNTKEILEKLNETRTERQNKLTQLIDSKKEEYKKENPKEELEFEMPENATEEIKTKLKKDHKLAQKAIDDNYEFLMNREISENKEIKELIKTLNDESETEANEEHEVIVEEKTAKVVKKYFEQYGQENGWSGGDDDVVCSIAEKFESVKV